MHATPKTAIIGAGISGLTSAKNLADAGVDYDCFESSDRVGGNWAFRNPNGHSSAYRSLHIDTSRDCLSFKDFPMSDDLPDYPHHTEVKAYLDDYTDAFGLRRTHPVREPRPQGPATGRRRLGTSHRRRTDPVVRRPDRRQRTPLGPTHRGLPRRVHRAEHPRPRLHRPHRAVGPARQAHRRGRHRQLRCRPGLRTISKVVAKHGLSVDPIRRMDSAQVPLRHDRRQDRSHPAGHPAVLATPSDATGATAAVRQPRELRTAHAQPQLLGSSPHPIRRTADAPGRGRRQGQAQHRALGRQRGALRRRVVGRGGRDHLRDGVQHHVPVLRRDPSCPRRTTICRCSSACSSPGSTI